MFEIQKNIIEFDSKFSEDKMPIHTTNLDPVGAMLFNKIHNNWPVYNFVMKYLLGSYLPSIQSELVPGIRSSALIAFVRKHDAADRDTLIKEGRMIQRFWLTATKLGLVLHPNYFPMALNYYKNNEKECAEPSLIKGVEKIYTRYNQYFSLDNTCFLGRIGWPKSRHADSRSMRKHWSELMIDTRNSSD